MNNQPYILIDDEFGNEWAIRNEDYWKQKAQEKYNLLLKRSNIPNFYWNIEWSDYKGTKSIHNVEKCKKYSTEFFMKKFDHVHLYLWGNQASTQKTACACNIGKEAIKQDYKVKFILGGQLINHLMKLQGFSFNQEIQRYIDDLKSQDILIIDDIFNEDSTLIWKNSVNNKMIILEFNNFFRDVFSSTTKVIITSNIEISRIKELYSNLFWELIDRNCEPLLFEDSIKQHKMKKFENLWE